MFPTKTTKKGSRFNDDVGEEKEEGFSFYADVVEEEEEEGEEGFASDFYKAGSGWSCLVADEEVDKVTPEDKKMKQANLFQIWRFEKITPEAKKKNVKQTNLFQIWGSQKPLPSTSPPSSSAKKTTTASRKRLRDSPLTNDSPRHCPIYKKLPGTLFTVDAFRYGCVQGCSAYFLTHFHADHYIGLTKSWSRGPIYCSSLTNRLLRLLSVNPSFIHPLELYEEYTINGIIVTLIEANHCPGAALIHFRLLDGTMLSA